MSGYDPAEWPSYGAYLRAKKIQTRAGGWTSATRDQVSEGRDGDGRRYKRTTDQLGNHVIQHGADQQSVHIKAPCIEVALATSSEKRN